MSLVSLVTVLGAGPIGASIAQRLAERARVREVRLIDGNATLAQGKALDLMQTAPIDGSDIRLSGGSDPIDAISGEVIVLADDTVGGAWEGDRGLGLIDRLVRAGTKAPIVFATAGQTPLIETAVRELHVPADRLVGTAASAMDSIVSSLVHIECGQSGAVVSVVGRPPSFVIGWSAATVGGALVSDRVPAHRLAAIAQSLSRLWPPGPQAIAAPTALIIEALISGSRRTLPAVTILDEEFGARGRAALMPTQFGNGRVLARVMPTLSPQEFTSMATIVSAG